MCPPPLYKWPLQVKSCSNHAVLMFGLHLTVSPMLWFVSTVTVFTESHPSDVSETASQSVPMVSTSTASLSAPGDDGDDVFVAEAESEGWALVTVS